MSTEIFLILILLAIVATVFYNFIHIVRQQTAFTVETLGKYSRVLMPGFNLIIPFVEVKARKINLSTMTLDCPIVAITSDKVNIKIDTALVYQVIQTKIYEAAYSLDNPVVTIRSLIDNSIRAFVATQTHEEVIRSRDEMTHYLMENLTVQLDKFGYSIDSFQFRDITLPKEITEAMSRVVASKRLQEAASNEAQAEYIRTVRTAEAQKQTRLLQGEGLALERKAITEGLAQSIQEMQAITGVNAESLTNIVLANQYIDMLKTITTDKSGNTKTVFLNPSVSSVSDILQQFSALQK